MSCAYCINNDGICQQRCIQSQQVAVRAEDKKFIEKLSSDAREKFELQILEKRSK